MTSQLFKALIFKNHKKVILIFLLPCFFFSQNIAASNTTGVLVTSKTSAITKLERKDVRRIFLGLKPLQANKDAIPVLNISNASTYRLFLKNIMFLTESGYQRKLVKRVFRQGADKIHSIDSIDELSRYLAQHPNNISFMLEEEALKHADIIIIQGLW
ncbi:MAG: hypothetical protein OEY11_01845 [Gammaproteobacteria bacterium]|nr:hypothetical protein [Gammaproteobacteria bacterium]